MPEIRTYCQCDPVFARGTGNSNVFWDNLYGHHYNYAYSNDFDRREVKLIPDVSQALARLEKNPQALQGIQRGLERETLRVNADGSLATTGHPQALGSALTHKWITTDFAEALLEFITPVDGDIQHMLTFMRDVHRYTARQLGDERMWPLSMPCYIAPRSGYRTGAVWHLEYWPSENAVPRGVEEPLWRADANYLRRAL